MYTIALSDGTETAIQTVYWSILILFFVLTTVSWLIASRSWFKEETTNTEEPEENKQIQNSPK